MSVPAPVGLISPAPPGVTRARRRARVTDVALSMARLRGALEGGMKVPPDHCPYDDRARRQAWIGGYLCSLVSTLASDPNGLAKFPVKPRGDWSEAEIELLAQSWRSALPTWAIGRLVGRSPRAVRSRACRAGLGARPRQPRRQDVLVDAGPAEALR